LCRKIKQARKRRDSRVLSIDESDDNDNVDDNVDDDDDDDDDDSDKFIVISRKKPTFCFFVF
jgi:hypothetical protein